MKICVVAGHTSKGKGTGAVGFINESAENRVVGKKIVEYLKMAGHDAVYGEINESTTYLADQVAIANKSNYDLVVQIHFNAGGGTGTETYYCTGNSDGKEFADHVQQGMLDAVGLRNRGVKSARFAVLRRTNMTAILVETAFIDTASDAKHLASESSRKAFAEGIARGICKYVGIEFK